MKSSRKPVMMAAVAATMWMLPATPAAALVNPVVHVNEFAQSATPSPRVTTPAQPASPTPAPWVAPIQRDPLVGEADAGDLRRELESLLRQYPPSLTTVLRADPFLLGDPNYLATYPELARFVQTYPQVARDARYYVGEPGRPLDAQSAAMELWRNMFEALSIISVMVSLVFGMGWLVRTVLDYRRWLRMSKVQVDVHQKLFDRLATNDDLMRYVQTPAGQRFLDSAPIALDAPSKGGEVSAPINRILWSVQIGVVLAAAGVGLLWISGRVAAEVSQFLSFVGVMGLTLGIGFVVSAGVAFLISRRLGLIAPGGQTAERPAVEPLR